LLSELCAQFDVTLLLPQVKVGATAAPHASTAFLAVVFPKSWRRFVKYWSEQGKT